MMPDNAIVKDQASIRNEIMDFESILKDHPDVFLGDTINCPLTHSFVDGIYVRKIFIPKGTILTGKIHKHAHPNFLMSGEVMVVTESGGQEILKAPVDMISIAGTKRVVHSLTDVVWITIHHNPTNTQDLSKLEKMIIAPSYEAYDKYKKFQNNYLYRLILTIKKNLQ